jgi:hypothetical protein
MMRKRRTVPWIGRLPLLLSLALTLASCMDVQTPVVPTLTPLPTPTPERSAASTNANVPLASSSIALDSEGFADPAFRALWQQYDGAVASGQVSRGWFWGQPVPFGAEEEPYAESPGGKRLVEYFDKGRMEINDPKADPSSEWYVTSGLLTTELVTGRVQVGANAFQTTEPAQLAVTGDLDNADPATPLYADFAGVRMAAAPNRTGQPVNTKFVHGQGDLQITPPASVTIGSYDETVEHNIADIFVNYFDHDLTLMGLNWLYVMGHPISEPYWVTARFGGKSQLVLVQLFERRALSFNPNDQPGLQVEFTNIGLHYYRWRYHGGTGQVPTTPAVACVEPPRFAVATRPQVA